ncbi:hypothetical protein [Streptomyces sp. NPDC048425]|uniref:hypothetical protein n=1 Tax=Streptomyces sp. NPDC048425 TaxID=3365548 RepID=UPI003719C907
MTAAAPPGPEEDEPVIADPESGEPEAGTPAPAAVAGDRVHNYFYGVQQFGQSHFGIRHGSGDRLRTTGRMPPAELDRLLHAHVNGPLHHEAAQALRRDHVVVLCGADGLGKAAAAACLLTETIPGTRRSGLVVLSPDTAPDRLANRTYHRGTGYLLLDLPDGTGLDDFAWRTVADRVRACGAHLVATTTQRPGSEGRSGVRRLGWRPPAAEEVLAAHLGAAQLAGDDIARARECVPDHATPAELAVCARRIAEGGGIGEECERLDDRAKKRAAAWFARERGLAEIVEVSVLAFATAVSRRKFEQLQVRLEVLLDPLYAPAPTAADPQETAAVSVPVPVPATAAVRRPTGDRRRALARNELAALERTRYRGGTREIVTFDDPELRRWILRELWQDQPAEYWDAVHHWLTELVATTAADATLVTVASGLALLGNAAFDEVADRYLEPWARGAAGEAGLYAAVYTLWWMCLDEAQATAALRFANSWANSGRTDLRDGARVAFSGLLGVAFPQAAVRQLWHLTRVAGDAPVTQAWADLFGALTSEGQDAGIVLDVLREQLDRGRAPHITRETLGHVRQAALAVLTVRNPANGHLAVVDYLLRCEDQLPLAAGLWARLLVHRPVRRQAVAALAAAAHTIPEAAGSASRNILDTWGRALADALPVPEHGLLVDHLRRADPHCRDPRRRDPYPLDDLLRPLTETAAAAATHTGPRP